MSGAGCKNRFIVIEKLTRDRDQGMAVKPNSFTERCRVWAERTQKPGTESGAKSHENVSTQEVEWCIWFRADILRTDRIIHEGTTYEITDIREEGYRAELKLTTKAVRPK